MKGWIDSRHRSPTRAMYEPIPRAIWDDSQPYPEYDLNPTPHNPSAACPTSSRRVEPPPVAAFTGRSWRRSSPLGLRACADALGLHLTLCLRMLLQEVNNISPTLPPWHDPLCIRPP